VNARGRSADAERRPTVVLVDGHPVVLAGMRTWFRRAGILVLAAGDSPDVAWQPPGAAADVVVLDPHPPGRSGPAHAALDRLVAGGRRVVVHTVHHDEEAVARCCRVGGSAVVCAVVPKVDGEAQLVAAVLAAAGDRPWPPAPAAAARPLLTSRERDVLIAWLRCESKRSAALLCHLSPRTVEGYIDRIRQRYAEVGRPAPTKAGLVARALQDGLIALDEL
jgi:DNA-binding NarL/FixJ family response regulator